MFGRKRRESLVVNFRGEIGFRMTNWFENGSAMVFVSDFSEGKGEKVCKQ